MIMKYNETEITITRSTPVEDGPNTTWESETLDPQVFSVYNKRASQPDVRYADGGELSKVELMLLCPIDADIQGAPGDDPRQATDEFTYGSRRYRVVYVREYKGFGRSGSECKQAGCVGV